MHNTCSGLQLPPLQLAKIFPSLKSVCWLGGGSCYKGLLDHLEITLFENLTSLALDCGFFTEPILLQQLDALVKKGKFTCLRNFSLLGPLHHTADIRLPPFPHLQTLAIFPDEPRLQPEDLEIKHFLEGNISLLRGLKALEYHWIFDALIKAFLSESQFRIRLVPSEDFVPCLVDMANVASR